MHRILNSLTFLFAATSFTGAFPFTPVYAHPTTVTHRLDIHIDPATHALTGSDRMIVKSQGKQELTFRLSPRLALQEVIINDRTFNIPFENGFFKVPLSSREVHETHHIQIRYFGIFDDPAPLHPLNMDNPGFGVNASISERGCLLLAGAAWYPELADAFSTYELNISAPMGWLAVATGRLKSHREESEKSVSEWVINHPSRGIALSAGRFILKTKQAGTIKAATYFLSDEPDLANAYLEAVLGYLRFYSQLFGSYAFDQFAVVENFFPTGYGFPSFTLLGSRVLRLPFMIQTSLAHEIAHCWWGNGVGVDYRQGNWSEGLTTYVADYLLKERQSAAEARSYRQRILRNYASLVPNKSDFPLIQFINRQDPLTKAIGYDKSAMVFHMLRRLIGDEAFWETLRDIYRKQCFRSVSWDDLQAAFEKRSSRSLQGFFDQWVRGAGAPEFRLTDITACPLPQSDTWKITGQIRQDKKIFAFPVLLELKTASGALSQTVRVTDRRTPFEFTAPAAPRHLSADPRVDLMRRLDSREIPPTVNSLKAASRVLVLLSGKTSRAGALAKILIESLGIERFQMASMNKALQTALPTVDMLVVGQPPTIGELSGLLSEISVDFTTFQVEGVTHDHPGDVFFGAFNHPRAADRVVAFFWPLSGREGVSAAAKITHYGDYSFLAFRNCRNTVKGIWPMKKSPLEYHWLFKPDEIVKRQISLVPQAFSGVAQGFATSQELGASTSSNLSF